MMSDLPNRPRILDIGCGPGMQTVELLKLTDGTVVALDVFAQMLDRVTELAAAEGVGDRLETLEMDMNQMEFADGSFDVVWSEGAIYFLGFEGGLRKVKPFVKAGGFVAVSEAVWLKEERPQEVVDFWQEYPEIDTVENKLAVIDSLGYESVGHFVLPPSAWTDEYYDPMQQRIDEKRPQWVEDEEGAAVLQMAQHEIDVFRRNPDCFSYAFFVMRT